MKYAYLTFDEQDFDFVHQILSYTRLHEDTQTATKTEILGSNGIENLKMLNKVWTSLF